MAITPISIEKWPEKPIVLRQENDVNARVFQIDLSDYVTEFGAGGTFSIRIQRLADGNIWTGEVTESDGIVTWTVPAAAVARAGRGYIQFVYTIAGEIVANTPMIPTITPTSIPSGENPPDPWKDWADQIEDEIEDLQEGKQDVLTFDQTPTEGSTNPVTSGGVYDELIKKADKVEDATADDIATLDANGNLKAGGKKIADLQDKLNFDTEPTNGSANPVTSGGVYEALTTKAAKSVVDAISELIPPQATAENQLADKNFVNSSVSTNTANYISNNGEPFTSVAQLEAYSGTVTNNDYAFVTGTDSAGNTYYDRYKATVAGGVVSWAKEYRLNNSSFTAEQWAAIESGITATLVASYNAHLANTSNPHNVTKAQVGLGNVDNTSDANKPVSTAQQAALDQKQNVLTFDSTPTAGSSNPVTSAGIKAALDAKADKVFGAVSGNLAGLDANGNLTDSGSKPSDFEPAAFGIAQNDPEQSVFDAVIAQAAAAPLLKTLIKGKTVAWNQLVDYTNFRNRDQYSVTITNNNNGSITISGTAEQSTNLDFTTNNFPLTVGHVYCLLGGDSTISVSCNDGSSHNTVNGAVIFTAASASAKLQAVIVNGNTYGLTTYIMLIDLTAEGYTAAETTDVATFKAAFLRKNGFPLPQYIPYNAGSLKNVDGEYRLRGRNLWDEEWEVGGINDTTGAKVTENSQFRSVNYIPVVPSSNIFIGFIGTYTNNIYVYYYDAEKNFISRANVGGYNVSNKELTVPDNCRYALFKDYPLSGGVTYHKDICINLSDASFNGQYEKYYNGGSIDCSAEPLNGFDDTVCDEKDYATGERITRFPLVDLGTLDWYQNSYVATAYNASLPDIKVGATGFKPNACCAKYTISVTVGVTGLADNSIMVANGAALLVIRDDNYTSDVVGIKAALSGTYLGYEAATPTTSTETPQPLYSEDGYNVLEPVSGGVQSAEVAATYVKTSGIATLINWIKAQIAAIV